VRSRGACNYRRVSSNVLSHSTATDLVQCTELAVICCVFMRAVSRTPAYRPSQLLDTAATNSQQMHYTKIEVLLYFRREFINSLSRERER